MDLGMFGVWSGALRNGERSAVLEAAAELEELSLRDGGSDRLVDAIVAWGTPEQIIKRVKEHHAAGADHVCIQVLTETPQDLPTALNGWRTLAATFAN